MKYEASTTELDQAAFAGMLAVKTRPAAASMAIARRVNRGIRWRMSATPPHERVVAVVAGVVVEDEDLRRDVDVGWALVFCLSNRRHDRRRPAGAARRAAVVRVAQRTRVRRA